MRKSPFREIIRNRILLIGIVASIVLATGSLAFIRLNGTAHSSSTQEPFSGNQELDVPSDLLPTQNTPAGNLAQPIEDVDPTSPVKSETSSEPFSIINETTCIPSDTDYQVATVVDALDTDSLSVQMDGETYTLKFLGIDTHVIKDELRDDVLSANTLLIGQTVALIADASNHDEEGNLLRYVFTENVFINQALLERGLAAVSENLPAEACADVFQQAQETAQLQEVGTWARLKPEDWQEWPVVPVISDNAIEIYSRGLEAGTDPQRFTIIGDCQNIPGGSLFRRVNWEDFTLPPDLQYLQTTVENFRSIWSREPITVSGGFIPASMFSTYWTDTEQCDAIETPLECEFRQNNASIVLISIGSDQKPGTEEDFDRYIRKIVDYSIERNVLPVLATDAYGTEKDFPLNQIMAQIAYDYDIPLWNFWASVQDLPNHGLKEDNFHINAEAFAIKRITGIQVLHAVLTAAQE
jgi:endonuclease YncB( thermonuclease family)